MVFLFKKGIDFFFNLLRISNRERNALFMCFICYMFYIFDMRSM